MSVYVGRHYQPNVRALSRNEEHWFHIVQKQRLRDISRVFLSSDVDPNCINTGGVTALGLSAQLGYTDVIDLLIQNGVDVNKQDFYGLTALHYSAEYGQIRAMRHLIRAGANVNCTDQNNAVLTPIHIATCSGRRDAVQTLIEHNSNVNASDINGTSVLLCGVSNAKYEIVEDLLNAKADINFKGTFKQKTALHMASELGDKKMLKLLLDYRPKLHLTDGYGMTALCSVCYQNNSEVADILLKAGSRVNIADEKKSLPLHYAARNGNVQLLKDLLKHGSKIDVLNQYFESPLHLAVRMAHVEVIRCLVESGCDVNICQQYTHVMPLHIAVNSYTDSALFNQVLLLLIQGGADLNSRAFTSLETPLFRAVGEGKVEMAVSLVKHGADCSVESMYDLTILQKACRRDLVDFIDIILSCGAIQWQKETWLNIGALDSGINKDLLKNYEHDIPLSLHGKLDLYFAILEARQTMLTLTRYCRLVIRKAMSNKLYIKVRELGLPKKLQDFIMMEIV